MIVIVSFLGFIGFFVGLPLLIICGGEFIENFNEFNTVHADESGSHGQVTKLKWKTIKDIYRISKWRWRYEEVVSSDGWKHSITPCLLYNAGDGWSKNKTIPHTVYPYYNKDKIIRIQLSFKDYIKFLWAKKFAKEKDLGAEILFATAQADIDKVRDKARAEIEEGQRIMAEIIAKQTEKTEENKNITLSL